MTAFTPHTFTHPTLGRLTGRAPHDTPGITHFRSIPFASIPSRFRQAIMKTSFSPNDSRDFTEYSTACPAPDQLDQIEAVGGLLPGEEPRKFDEWSCLNLTITVPTKALANEEAKLPVMVYVHGGAFKVGGGHVSDLHDTTRLVEMSVKEGHPVILVSIHYRLNWFGFLACQDLIDQASLNNEPPSNYGLYDQRTAFQWISRFIPGFGGSPTNITAFGESAGSGSIALHMCSNVPLFKRAILMSGTTATGPPVDLKYKEAEYRALLGYLGIDEKDGSERLRMLREVSAEKLVEAISGVGIPLFNSLRDGNFFPRGFPTWWTQDEIMGSCEWIDDVMIGDGFLEGWIMSEPLKHISPSAFLKHSDSILGASNAHKILSAYDITSSTHPNAFWTKLLYLMGDLMFSEPSHKFVNYLASQHSPNKKKIYRYTMTMRNPFPGSNLHQIPGHHFIDILFLFQTLRERYPTKRLRNLSEEFGKAWLRFGVGKEPWDEFKKGEGEEKIMVFNGVDGCSLRSRKEDERLSAGAEEGERRYKGWEAIAEVMGDLAKAKRGVVSAEETRLAWGPDGGVFRLIGLKGPYGVVIP